MNILERAIFQFRSIHFAAAAAALLFATPALAQSEADFFKGKTITFLVSTTSGGSYDTRARIMARHLGKQLPGSPNVVVQNMPGAGSVVAMNHMYNVAPKDGTFILITQRVIFTTPMLTPEGVQFDLEKYNWLGNMGTDNGLLVSWHESPIKTTADIFTKEMIVAGSAQTTIISILNALIGTKFKLITGYPGAADMQLAMERGEVMGPGEWSWSDLKTTRQDWIQSKKINLLLQNGLTKTPDLPNVPLSLDYVKNEDDRKILEVFVSQRQLAYPILMPPGMPATRVATMRKAFLDLGNDPDFKADFTKLNLEYDLMPGDKVQELVSSIVATPPVLVERMKVLVDAKR